MKKPKKKMTELRRVRVNQNLTQKEVAEALDITAEYLSLIELEKRTPSLELAIKLAKFYEVSLDHIFM